MRRSEVRAVLRAVRRVCDAVGVVEPRFSRQEIARAWLLEGGHDVSGESRDERGEWTKGGGDGGKVDLKAVARDLVTANKPDPRTMMSPLIPALFDRLKEKHPGLTEPVFHALLKDLQDRDLLTHLRYDTSVPLEKTGYAAHRFPSMGAFHHHQPAGWVRLSPGAEKELAESFDPSEPRDEKGEWTKGGGTGRVKTPLKVASGQRPYKYPGVTAIDKIESDPNVPTVHLDPRSILTWQPGIDKERLDKVQGDVRRPVVVVEWEGKYYIEEGNHRAAAALRDGKKVPARIIKGTPAPPPDPEDE